MFGFQERVRSSTTPKLSPVSAKGTTVPRPSVTPGGPDNAVRGKEDGLCFTWIEAETQRLHLSLRRMALACRSASHQHKVCAVFPYREIGPVHH